MKKKSPKVAVCIASYKNEPLLQELLASLKKQTFQDFKTYIVRDVSPIGKAKHDVVELALKDNPKYICMIDNDDIVRPTYLEEVVRRMTVGDIDWCLVWGQLFGERSGFIHSSIEPYEELLKANNHRHSWISAKADLFRKENYNPHIYWAEDWDLWKRLDRGGYKGDIIKKELYMKRWHSMNLTQTRNILQTENTGKYRFHLLGLVHLPVSERYMPCAFTQKIVKISKMLLGLGHEVFLYGCEGSDAPCTEFIQTHTLDDVRKEWGDGDNRFEIGYDWKSTQFRHDFNSQRTRTTLKYYENAIKEINMRKRNDDFLLISQGVYQKPIANDTKLYLTCEFGVGYRGSYADFRAFESAYLQNFTYGFQNNGDGINGKYYDRVIPNYFDKKNFHLQEKKGDYYLYIGRLILRKGVWTAIKATQAIGKKLIIAGQMDPEINVKDFPKGVEYIGSVGAEERDKLMGGAIASFVPTIYLESFGGVGVEAMLCGTPILTTNFGVFPEYNIDGVTGYLCNTLDDFIYGAKNAHKLSPKKIRKHAERFLLDYVKWEYQRWFDDLYNLYESTVSDKKGWHRIRSSEPAWRRRLYKKM